MQSEARGIIYMHLGRSCCRRLVGLRVLYAKLPRVSAFKRGVGDEIAIQDLVRYRRDFR